MKQELTADALVRLVHRYYPSGILIDEPRYKSSEEAQHLEKLLQDTMQHMHDWERFVLRLHDEFPGCMLWDQTLLQHDPCYVCQVALPGMEMGGSRYDAVVCMLSLLAPVYAIYATHTLDAGALLESWIRFPPLPPEFQAHEARLAELIESTFGFTRLATDVLATPVPELRPRTGHFALGGARLIDCLFTPNRI